MINRPLKSNDVLKKNSNRLINTNHHFPMKKTKGILKKAQGRKPKKTTFGSLIDQSLAKKLIRDKKKSGIKRNSKKNHD